MTNRVWFLESGGESHVFFYGGDPTQGDVTILTLAAEPDGQLRFDSLVLGYVGFGTESGDCTMTTEQRAVDGPIPVYGLTVDCPHLTSEDGDTVSVSGTLTAERIDHISETANP